MMFAEKAGFTHVHFHVVPRMDDFPDDRIGPGVLGYLRETPLPEQRRDELAAKIRSAWPSD
jgi:diadenosine tetraphosphate (Ap4A) HIT family hydrolase